MVSNCGIATAFCTISDRDDDEWNVFDTPVGQKGEHDAGKVYHDHRFND